MVYLIKKKHGKYVYYYLAETAWVEGRSRIVWQKYLGTADKIKELVDAAESVPDVKLHSFPFGRDAALLGVADELGFVDIVNAHTTKKKMAGLSVGEYALLTLMGRCGGPVSKEGMAKWFNRKTFLNLLCKFPHKLSGQNVRNHLDYLLKPEEEARREPGAIRDIEEDLGRALLTQGIEPTTLIWDTTNMFTNIEKGGTLPRKGNSKQKRFDKNLIAFGLAVSEENIPFLSEVYEANEHDATLFPKVFGRLVDRLTTLKVRTEGLTLVFDKGNHSEDNVKDVLAKMHLVGALKRDHPVAAEMLAIDVAGYEPLYLTTKKHEVKGFRRDDMTLFDIDRPFTVLARYNEETRKRQEGTYERNKLKILATLEELRTKAARPGGRGRRMTGKGLHRAVNDAIYKDYRGVFDYTIQTAEARLPGKSRKASILELEYGINEAKEQARYANFGKTVLFTDNADWSSAKISKTYDSKNLVEDDFACFKDKLTVPIAPIEMRKDNRIRVHVELCVWGMLFYRYLARKLKRMGIDISLKGMIEELTDMRLAVVRNKQSKKTDIKLEEMNSIQARLFSALDLGRYMP